MSAKPHKTYCRSDRKDGAFTLVEVLVAIALLGVITTAITLAFSVTVQNAQESYIRQVAQGLADDLMDEILNRRYCEPGASPYQYPLGPSPSEQTSNNRSQFDDIDDYHNLVDEPPKDLWGRPLGSEDGTGALRPPQASAAGLNRFRREVKVYYVSPTNFALELPAGQVSDFRRIEINIFYRNEQGQLRLMANLVRVVGHAPTEDW